MAKSITLSSALQDSEEARKAFEEEIVTQRAGGREIRSGTLELLIDEPPSDDIDLQAALLVTFEWSQEQVPVILRASPYQLLRFARRILDELDPSSSQ